MVKVLIDLSVKGSKYRYRGQNAVHSREVVEVKASFSKGQKNSTNNLGSTLFAVKLTLGLASISG